MKKKLTDLKGPFTMKCKDNHASIMDGNGYWIPELTDIELGWTDTETGPYNSPEEAFGRMLYILDALNFYHNNAK